eukprot:2230823-Rhodomonas_salina.1
MTLQNFPDGLHHHNIALHGHVTACSEREGAKSSAQISRRLAIVAALTAANMEWKIKVPLVPPHSSI